MAIIIKAKEFKPENVSFSVAKPNKHGGKIVYINYDYEDGNTPRPLRIQLPKMKAPFGVSGWSKSQSDTKSGEPTLTSNDTLELSFDDKTTDIIQKFHELENLAMQLAADNSKDFFKKKYTLAELKLFYKTSIKVNDSEDSDKQYPPRFKSKLLKDANGNYVSKLYNENSEKLDFNVENNAEVLPKGSECVSIIECSGLWIVNSSFGISWRPVQVKVYRNNYKLPESAFLVDSEGEDTEEYATPEELDTSEVPVAVQQSVLDSEDDLDTITEHPKSKPRRRTKA